MILLAVGRFVLVEVVVEWDQVRFDIHINQTLIVRVHVALIIHQISSRQEIKDSSSGTPIHRCLLS